MFCLLWMATCDLALENGPQRIVERVDLIELNHVWTEDTSKHVLSQIILWRVAEDGRFHVVAWACCDEHQQLPATSPWLLVSQNKILELHFFTTVEYWSNYDREIADREEWPDREPFWTLSRWIRRSR